MLASPTLLVAKRELRTTLRSTKSALFFLAFTALLLWMASTTMAQASSYTAQAGAMRSYFSVQAIALHLVAIGILPAMAATTISSERESGNFSMLATTLLPLYAVVTGKFLAVLVYFSLYLITVLPFMGLVYFYAGMDVLQFFETLLSVAPIAFTGVAVGVWSSGAFSSSSRSVVFTFLSLGALSFFVVLSMPFSGVAPMWLWNATLPAGAVPTPDWNSSIKFALVYTVIGTVLVADAAGGYPFRRMGQRVLARHALPDADSVGFPFWMRIQELRQAIPPLTIPDGQHPFGYRELYGSLLYTQEARRILFVLTAIFYAGTIVVLNASGSTLSPLSYLERIALVAILPPLLALALVREREEATLEMSRMTPWTGAVMMEGKMTGQVRLLAPILLAVSLCKFVLAACTTAGYLLRHRAIGWDFGPAYSFITFYWLDIFLFPLNILLVQVTAGVGGVFPRNAFGAIAAASSCTFMAALPILFGQVSAGLTFSSRPHTAEVAAFSLIYTFFAFVIGLGIVGARLTTLWEARE